MYVCTVSVCVCHCCRRSPPAHYLIGLQGDEFRLLTHSHHTHTHILGIEEEMSETGGPYTRKYPPHLSLSRLALCSLPLPPPPLTGRAQTIARLLHPSSSSLIVRGNTSLHTTNTTTTTTTTTYQRISTHSREDTHVSRVKVSADRHCSSAASHRTLPVPHRLSFHHLHRSLFTAWVTV
jgi:hypothetical protein